jgi:hypothetical protein
MSRRARTPAFWLSAACGAILAVSFLLSVASLPELELCWFKALTQIPCPACGLTRSFLYISHGDWGRAWALNPFGFFWYPLVLYGLVRPLALRIPALSRPVERLLGWKPFFPLVVAAMILAWAWKIRSEFF